MLTWGDQPADLDSHLSGPDGLGGRFHILFSNRTPVDFADLDIDDTTGLGPERVKMRKSPSAGGIFVAWDYHYWVHNFNQSTYANSNTTVTVLVNGVQLGRFLVASAICNPDDDIWRVINVQINTNVTPVVTPIQTFQQGDQNTIL